MSDRENRGTDEASHSIGRLAVYADPEHPTDLVGILQWTKAGSELTFHIEGDVQNTVERTLAALEHEVIAKEAPSALMAELRQAFTRQSLHTTDITAGDYAIRVEFDLNTGRAVGRNEPLHPHLASGGNIGRDVFGAMAHAMRTGIDQLTEELTRSASAAEVVQALRRAQGEGVLGFFPTPELLASLEKTPVAELPASDRRYLRQARLEVAQLLQQHERMAVEAEALLEEFRDTCSPVETAQLEMAVGVGLIKRGLTEAALAVWRRLVEPGTPLDAAGRGWAWRNIAIALPTSTPEARLAAQRSADAFLEAGDKLEAGKSLLRLADCLMTHSPDQALDALNDMFVLVEQEGLSNQQLRAAVHHARANRLLALRAIEPALEDARQAIALLEGLLGVETQRIGAMNQAAAALMILTREEEAKAYSDAADELAAREGEPHFEAAKKILSLFEAFDAARAEALETETRGSKAWEQVAAVVVARATKDPMLTQSQRLARLEGVIQDLRQANAPRGTTEAPRRAIAALLTTAGEHDRAAAWWAQLAEEMPWDIEVITNLVNTYVRLERWEAAETLLRRQIALNGEQPGFLFFLGRVLCESGRPSEALTALQRALRLAEEGSDLRRVIMVWRDKALDSGGTLTPSVPLAPRPLDRSDLEVALDAFAAHISKSQRMSFWRMVKGKRSWVSQPERQAKDQLHTFLQARFADRIEVFSEIATGAGRLDLLLKLAGGLTVIVELKMCGFTYASTYAAAGQDQILHYMANRDTRLGYLVVFDARIDKFASPVLGPRPPDSFTVFERFVDVRPTWSASAT